MYNNRNITPEDNTSELLSGGVERKRLGAYIPWLNDNLP